MSDHAPTSPATPSLRQEADDAAAEAARGAGVEIRDVDDLDHLARMSQLFDEVWGREPQAPSIMSPELLRAMSHAGNQVSAAFRDGEMVGATAALIGLHADELHLHSHVTAVVSGVQGTGVGWAMKQHQRAWCLARDITTVRWTFDPLIRRNAVFNLSKLGARVTEFVENLYGAMPDARNAGLPTDRVIANWALTERRVQLASAGRFAEPDLSALRNSGAEVVLAAGPNEEPAVGDAPPRTRLVLAQVPADIEGIRETDRDRAERWAAAFREVVGDRIATGYRVTGVTRDGWYVLARDDEVEELAR